MRITDRQKAILRRSALAIEKAKKDVAQVNEEMKAAKCWYGQGDVAALAENLKQLCKCEAGAVGDLLREIESE